MYAGEFEIDSINSVEDTKGNNGEKGALKATNLRLIWVAQKNPRTNLSIGYDCILNTNVRLANSRLRGNSEALYVMSKFGGTRFEFIFTSLVQKSPRLFTTVQAVYKAYESTKLFRDLKLRGAIMKDKNLILLPDEQIVDKVPGVWNLSSEQGNLGALIVTNVRIVWYANLAENFNVSIPYVQVKLLDVRHSKFGEALVIQTSSRSGSYTLGFKIDPAPKLRETQKQLQNLHKIYSANPNYGVKFQSAEETKPVEDVRVQHIPDKIEVIDDDDIDIIGAYYADANKNSDKNIIFSTEIGLAIEELPKNVTLSKLWNVIPTNAN